MKLNPAWFSAPLALALSPLLWNSQVVAQYDSTSLDPLLLEYANSNDQRKKQISEQITKSVQLQFDQRHTAQQQEIKWLEEQLTAKKKTFEKREALQEKIVKDRVESLLQRAEGTGWDPAWTPAPYLPINPMPSFPGYSTPPNALPGLIPPIAPLQEASTSTQVPPYPKALVSYEDFKELVAEVETHRKERILSLDDFLAMSKQPNVMILDTRSDFRYERIHIQGAKHLSFTDFTQANLAKVIPSPDTIVLIYCNNNFDGNQVDFASKSAPARPRANNPLFSQVAAQTKPVQLALNVPTYINLYGYGYRNVYELGELVKVTDPRIEFEGTIVGK
jgi:rhodanese-related sulfurtransferase